MHIIPAIENNADGFSSFALHVFKQHPPLPSRALPGLPKCPKHSSPGNSKLSGHSPRQDSYGNSRGRRRPRELAASTPQWADEV